MFTLGGTELLLLGVLVLLLFGPDKVPQLARTLGRAMREFNKYKDIMESAFRVEMQAAEMKEAEKSAKPGEESTEDLERLKKAAAASREFAAERGTEIPDAATVLGTSGEPLDEAAGDAAPAVEPPPVEPAASSVPAPAAEAPHEGAFASTATDEDEEEG